MDGWVGRGIEWVCVDVDAVLWAGEGLGCVYGKVIRSLPSMDGRGGWGVESAG